MFVGGTSYTAMLYIAGASLDEALIAMPFVLGLSTTTGRPFGKFLDWYRKKIGTTPVYEKLNKETETFKKKQSLIPDN